MNKKMRNGEWESVISILVKVCRFPAVGLCPQELDRFLGIQYVGISK